jgi:hypothetical protein
MESLENRQLFAASFTLTDCSFSPTVNCANVTARGFHFGWWADTSAFTTPAGFDDSKARMVMLARIAENGGIAPWTGKTIPPRTPTILDFGADEGHDLTFYTQRLRWFKQFAPHVKVAMIGVRWGVLDFLRETVAYPTAQDQAAIDADLSAGADFAGAMDFLPIYAYMLGPAGLDRDLKFIENSAADFKKAFPGKTVVTWTWGVYHPSWNPPGTLLSDVDTQRLIQTCMDNSDGIIAWGPQSDNEKLTSMALQMSGVPTGLIFESNVRPPQPNLYDARGLVPELFSSEPILA